MAGIQSVYKRACDLDRFDLIIVDECHLLAEKGEGMYLTFLHDMKIINPNVRVIGLTATPFRLNSGQLCKPENVLNHVCYEANVKELILQGWLCPLRTRRGLECANLEGVRIASTGDFASDEMQAAFESIIKPACEELAGLCADRHSILIFAAGVKHAHLVAEALGGEVVTGKEDELDSVKNQFKGEMARISADIEAAKNLVRDGYEMRDVPVREERDYDTETITITRLDTFDVVEERRMRGDELQRTFPGIGCA